MSDTTNIDKSSKASAGAIVGIAAVACVACCVGPILAVLGAIVALGVFSTVFVGAAGLLITAVAIAAFVVVRWRRRTASCPAPPERVSVELGRRHPGTEPPHELAGQV